MWTILAVAAGCVLVLVMLWEAFETVLLPRAVRRGFRLTRLYYRTIWPPWAALARRLAAGGSWQASILSFFGPLSLLMLICLWAAGLVVGFGLVQWGLAPTDTNLGNLETGIYLSGTTFFTLGLGDVKPETPLTRGLAMLEAGIGFGFLATIISYLPVIYAAFSRREVTILRLDLRAGSPPTAGEFLRQHGQRGDAHDLNDLLSDFETWAAELLEAHLTYPVLCMYRSQHRDQSWLAALTTVLDTCALLVVGVEGKGSSQAPLTFAMARRALLDMDHLFQLQADDVSADLPDRLPPDQLTLLRATLAQGGGAVRLRAGSDFEAELCRLRATYEPAAHRLAAFLMMPLPAWLPPPDDERRPAITAGELAAGDGAGDVSIA